MLLRKVTYTLLARVAKSFRVLSHQLTTTHMESEINIQFNDVDKLRYTRDQLVRQRFLVCSVKLTRKERTRYLSRSQHMTSKCSTLPSRPASSLDR